MGESNPEEFPDSNVATMDEEYVYFDILYYFNS